MVSTVLIVVWQVVYSLRGGRYCTHMAVAGAVLIGGVSGTLLIVGNRYCTYKGWQVLYS